MSQRGRGVFYTHITLLGPTYLHTNYHQQPSKTELNFGLWWATAPCTRTSVKQRPSPTPHPIRLSFSLTSTLVLTHSYPPPPFPKKKHHHHLPSCRKFLMISIISVHCNSCQEQAHACTHSKHAHKAFK